MSTQSQLAFETAKGGVSQCDLIRDHLTSRPNVWVSLPDLYRVSGALAVATRISNLNKPYKQKGERAPYENRTDTSVRPHASWYRYATGAE